MPDRRPLDALAITLMVVLSAVWGANTVAVKLAAAGVPTVWQATLRSAGAALLVVAWARLRGIRVFDADRTLGAGMAAGALFGTEMLFIYAGLGLTTASRMTVFVYLAPVLTALAMSWWVPGERLTRLQGIGVAVAFAGIVLAFADGFLDAAPGQATTVVGDTCGVIAAALWAATTLVIRRTRLSGAVAEKTFLYQLGVSVPLLAAGAALMGQTVQWRIGPMEIGSLLFQVAVVAFASYLTWFWLLTRYLATRLSVFSFLTPLFGVAAGAVVLGDPLSSRFVAAALLVAAGIGLVNVRRS
jgi:drug/metabolite transporter (DMT)-like permease